MVNLILDNIPLSEQERLRQNLLADIPQDLAKDEVLTEWEKRAALAVVYTKTSFAYRLLLLLRQLLATREAALKLKYHPVLTWLYYAAWLDLSKEELMDFFRQADLSLILADPNYGDLVTKLKARLLLEPLNERDQWRERIFNAVHENEAVIAKDKIADWLKLYDSTVGLGVAESIAVAEFNNQAVEKNNLNEVEQEVLKKFLEFYEYIKLSSYDPAGFEEEIMATEGDRAYLLSNGEQIEIGQIMSEYKMTKPVGIPSEPRLDTVENISVSLPPLPDIIKQAQAYLLSTNGEIAKVIMELQKSVDSGNVLGATGTLVLLAQLRQLDDVLTGDERFLALVRDDLKASGQDDKVEGLRLNPTAPNFIARFLKIVLEDKLDLAAGEALAFGERLGKILAVEGEKYSRMVVEDGKGGRKWNL